MSMRKVKISLKSLDILVLFFDNVGNTNIEYSGPAHDVFLYSTGAVVVCTDPRSAYCLLYLVCI